MGAPFLPVQPSYAAFRKILLALHGNEPRRRMAEVLAERIADARQSCSLSLRIHQSRPLQVDRRDFVETELAETRVRAQIVLETIDLLQCDCAILDFDIFASRLHQVLRAEHVLRVAAIPCITFGSKLDDVLDESCAASAHGPVLFATNFLEPGIATIQLAARLSQILCLPLECVHVLPQSFAAQDRVTPVISDLMRNALYAGATGQAIAISPEHCHIVYGNAVSDSLAALARRMRAALLVLAVSSAPAWLERLQPGIVERLLESAPCPVVTQRSDISFL